MTNAVFYVDHCMDKYLKRTPFADIPFFPSCHNMKLVIYVISCALVQLLSCWAALESFDINQRSAMAADTLVRRDELPSTSTSKHGDKGAFRTDHQGNNAVTNQQPRSEPLIRRSSRSPASPSRSSSISAATPASSTISRSDWSELRHQKSWTTSESDSSSLASVNSHKTKRTSRSGTSGSSSKRTNTKSSRKSLGDLAMEDHSSDSSDDSRKHNSMLHRARKMGFNVRTDGSLTSWPQLNHEAPNQYQRTLSRSPNRYRYRSLSPGSRSRHSDSHVNSDSETSSHSSRAHQR